jgi:GNAT superfamily N-acetyltransferase
MIRTASSPADFELSAEIYNEVSPRGVLTPEQAASSPGTTLLAGEDGFAYVDRSSIPGAGFAMVRVRPSSRGRGVGGALLDAARAETRRRGFERIWGRVYEPDSESLRFVGARGLAEVNRDVEVVLTVEAGDGAWAPGIVQVEDRHLPGAYEVVVEAVPEEALPQIAAAPPYEEWLERRARDLAVDVVALDGDEVVGYAALYRWADRLENGLTAVLKTHRRRGLALALKRAQIAWAAEHGFTEISTATVEANVGMRAVNEQLGYRPLPAWIVVEGAA